MKYQLHNDEVDLKFSYTEGYQATFDDPGCDDEVEIVAIMYKDVDISPIISDKDYDAMIEFISDQIRTGYYDD